MEDETNIWERKQAFRCITRVFEISPKLFGAALTKGLMAVVSQREDRLRALCLELLRNLLLSNPGLVAECDGTKLLFDAVVDPSLSFMAEPLLLSLLSVLNNSSTRLCLRPFHDVQNLLAPFTEIDFKFNADQAEVWAASSRAIVLMLRSWAGIVILSSDPHGLSSVLRLLKDHAVDCQLQFAVLNLVVDALRPVFYALRGNLPRVQNTSGDSKNIVRRGHVGIVAEQTYAAVLCSALIHCGLVEGLTFLGVRGEDMGEMSLRSRAIDLLSSFLVLAARIFPEESSAEFLSMPEVIEVVSGGSFGSERDRRQAGSNAQMMLVTLATSLSSQGGKRDDWPEGSDGPDVYAAMKGILWEAGDRHKSMADDASTLRDIKPTIDRKVFLSQLEDSQVNSTKEWRQWKWDVIRQLLEETLTQREYFVEALRNHKWIKRVCGFFRCDAGKERDKAFFAALPWEIKHVKKLECARLLFALLLETDEGKQYLQTDRRGSLFPAMLREIEKVVNGRNSIFDSKACNVTMAREFITILGHVSTLPFGQDFITPLLTEKKSALEKMGTKPQCDYLSRLLLLNLHFTSPKWPFPRELVTTWLHSKAASTFLRMCINSTIRDFLGANANQLLHLDLLDWAIDVLKDQFECDDLAVVEGAVDVMTEAVAIPEFLAFFVAKFPFELLRIDGKSARLEDKVRLLKVKSSATKAGLANLQRIDWVDHAIYQWQECDGRNYGRMVEASFSNILGLRPEASHAPRTISLRRPTKQRGSESIQLKQGEIAALDRLPWNISIRLQDSSSGPETDINLTKVAVHSIQTTSEGQTVFRIRGTIMGEDGVSTGINVGHRQTISAAIFLGSYDVSIDGSLRTLGGMDQRDSKRSDSHDVVSAQQLVEDMMGTLNWVSCDPTTREQLKQSPRTNDDEVAISSADAQALWCFRNIDGRRDELLAIDFLVSAATLSAQSHAQQQPHLYGELARTTEGCALLNERKVIASMCRQCWGKSFPAAFRFDSLLGLGQIGATDNGFKFLLASQKDIVGGLIDLAVGDDDLSIRGAAFCALGLWSHSSTACEHLQLHKWSSSGDPMLSISLPEQYSSMFNLSADGGQGAPKEGSTTPPGQLTNGVEREIVSLLDKLACSIYQKEAKESILRWVSMN